MNMKFILGLVFFVSTSLSAQKSNDDLNPQDPKAKTVLDALSAKAKGYSSFSADFEYTLKSAEVNETQKGSVMMKGQTKYKVKIAGQEVVCDGKTVWTYIADAKELQISDLPEEGDEDGNLLNPANAFHMYQKGFKYKHEGTAVAEARNVEVIKLFPMDPTKKNYHTIVLNIDTQKMELVSMIMKGKDGNVYTYKLKNFKANIPVTDSEFVFDESRADDIIDLRE